MKDIFLPRNEPERTIYAVFHAEAKKREHREFEVWVEAERYAVYAAAKKFAIENHLTVPTIEQVLVAEIHASGHIDYAAKWVRSVVEIMRSQEPFEENKRKLADQYAEDIAELISCVYNRSKDRDEFIANMGDYSWLKAETLEENMLFALCNKMWHGGYIEGVEEGQS